MWLVPHWFPSASMGTNVKTKIMAVDDDPIDLGLLKTTLEPYGYEVLAVGDSRDALKLLEMRTDSATTEYMPPGPRRRANVAMR